MNIFKLIMLCNIIYTIVVNNKNSSIKNIDPFYLSIFIVVGIKDIIDKSNKLSKKYENVNQDQGKQGQLFETNFKNLTDKVLEIIESHHEEQR